MQIALVPPLAILVPILIAMVIWLITLQWSVGKLYGKADQAAEWLKSMNYVLGNLANDVEERLSNIEQSVEKMKPKRDPDTGKFISSKGAPPDQPV